MVANRSPHTPKQLQVKPGTRKRGKCCSYKSESDPAPMTLRIVRTRPLAYSQRFNDTLQQFMNGQWKDVEVVNLTYPLPDGRTQ
jgi:hypothetical protein